MKVKLGLSLCALFWVNINYAAVDNKVQTILNEHFKQYKEKEYFSGGALSYLIPGQTIQNYYVGNISHEPKSAAVTGKTLFQIGSITKSFTAALLLKAEQNKLLSLQDPMVKWLPEYSNWPASITIKALLNMTSNLPNYSDAPLWYGKETQDLATVWTNRELISFVYPKQANIPLRTGYFYSNTGYILADLIYQKATKTSFDESMKKMVQDAKLKNTFYPLPTMDKALIDRMAHGYGYNPYDNPALVGKDVSVNNLTWAGSAGAMLSTPEDIIKWVQFLFMDKNFLSKEQRKRLMTLNSTLTGKPISGTSKEDGGGFALGVAQKYNEEVGVFWFYEGITLGFRGIYLYKPCNGVIVAASFNSTPDAGNDALGKLIGEVYQQILKENPHLRCGL